MINHKDQIYNQLIYNPDQSKHNKHNNNNNNNNHNNHNNNNNNYNNNHNNQAIHLGGLISSQLHKHLNLSDLNL